MPVINKKAIPKYDAKDFGDEEVRRENRYRLQTDDNYRYFRDYRRPILDRSYKLYVAYSGDRARHIKAWQSNLAVTYILGVVETMKPRILDARPDFEVLPRSEDDTERAANVNQILGYCWEKAEMDDTMEDAVSASMIFGDTWLRNYWKYDVRKDLKYFDGRDPKTKRKKWKTKKETVVFDGPDSCIVSNYDMRYDHRNIPHESKSNFEERLVLSGAEIKRRFPDADPDRLEMALNMWGRADLTDYASVYDEVLEYHTEVFKGSRKRQTYSVYGGASKEMLNRYQENSDPDMRFHEVKLRNLPFDDETEVRVNDVPVQYDGYEPNPYDHKEDPYVHIPFLRIPFRYEGVGYPVLLEDSQMLLNMIKNQRVDAVTMSIHGMWAVSPMSNVKKEQLVTQPFGIIWTPDPNGIREIKATPPNEATYKEEEMLKSDMRYASGVDDISMGVGGGAGSATETRQLREATLERVRLYINHLGSGLSKTLRQWLSMLGQYMTEEVQVRITGTDGQTKYRIIERDDIKGEYDLKAKVIPSIAGKSDIDKTTSMELFQVLAPFIETGQVDVNKLLGVTLLPWGKPLSAIAPDKSPGAPVQQGMPGQAPMPGAAPQDPMAAMAGMPVPPPEQPKGTAGGAIKPKVISKALSVLGGGRPEAQMNPLAALGSPADIAGGQQMPKPLSGTKPNPTGANKGGKPNLNANPTGNRGASDKVASKLNRASSLQKKK